MSLVTSPRALITPLSTIRWKCSSGLMALVDASSALRISVMVGCFSFPGSAVRSAIIVSEHRAQWQPRAECRASQPTPGSTAKRKKTAAHTRRSPPRYVDHVRLLAEFHFRTNGGPDGGGGGGVDGRPDVPRSSRGAGVGTGGIVALVCCEFLRLAIRFILHSPHFCGGCGGADGGGGFNTTFVGTGL